MVDIFDCGRPINQSMLLYQNQKNFSRSGLKSNNNISRKLQSLNSPVQRTTPKVYQNLIKQPNMNLTVDKFHVLKIMNRESESPGPQMRKLSKYLPLPNIKGTKAPQKPVKPPLLREKTYDVLEPIYVKGPMDISTNTVGEKKLQKRKPELPEIKEKSDQTVIVRHRPLKTPERTKGRRTIRTNDVSVPRKKQSVNSPPNKNNDIKVIKEKMAKKGYKFNPSVVNDDGPAHTVFWFPV